MSYIQKRGHNSAWRNALLRNLVTKLFIHKRLSLIHRRAKDLQPLAEKLITLAKKNDLSARRQAASILRNEMINEQTVLQHLFSNIADHYRDRDGGYTKIVSVKSRLGDNSKIVNIILI